MNRFVAILVALATLATSAVVAAPTASPLPSGIVDVRSACPVSGAPAKPEVAVLHEGKVYHFCCEQCVPSFTKDPAKYLATLKPSAEVPLTVTNPGGACPQSGETAKPGVFLVRGDTITFYCCSGCQGKDPLPAADSSKAATSGFECSTGACGPSGSAPACPATSGK